MGFHHKGWPYIKMNMVLQCLAVSQRSVFLQGQCLSWHKIDSTLAWMWIAVYFLLFERPGMMWEWHFPLTMWCCRVIAILAFVISWLCEFNPTEKWNCRCKCGQQLVAHPFSQFWVGFPCAWAYPVGFHSMEFVRVSSKLKFWSTSSTANWMNSALCATAELRSNVCTCL